MQLSTSTRQATGPPLSAGVTTPQAYTASSSSICLTSVGPGMLPLTRTQLLR